MTDVISLETVGSATTVINQGTVGPQGPVGAQGFPGLDGAAGLFVVSVTESTTVSANSFLLADTSGTDAGATYTFPASPQTGWRVRVLDVGGSVDTKPITVAGNGHDVADGGETRTISVPYAGESFVYVGETDSWQLEEKALKTQLGLSNVTNDAQVKRSEMGYPWSDVIPVTYLSPTSFSAPTDRTGEFSDGVRVRADCGADGLQYGTVESSSYADPTTTVTLTMDAENALTANLTGVLHGNNDKLSLVNHAHTGPADGGLLSLGALWIQPVEADGETLATVAYLSPTQFTVTGPAAQSDNFKTNRAIKAIQTASGTGYVSSSSYDPGTGLTTVTVSGIVLDAGLSQVWFGQDPDNAPQLLPDIPSGQKNLILVDGDWAEPLLTNQIWS